MRTLNLWEFVGLQAIATENLLSEAAGGNSGLIQNLETNVFLACEINCADIPEQTRLKFFGEDGVHGGLKIRATYSRNHAIELALHLFGAKLINVILTTGFVHPTHTLVTTNRGRWKNLFLPGSLVFDKDPKTLTGRIWSEGDVVFFKDDEYGSKWVQIGN